MFDVRGRGRRLRKSRLQKESLVGNRTPNYQRRKVIISSLDTMCQFRSQTSSRQFNPVLDSVAQLPYVKVQVADLNTPVKVTASTRSTKILSHFVFEGQHDSLVCATHVAPLKSINLSSAWSLLLENPPLAIWALHTRQNRFNSRADNHRTKSTTRGMNRRRKCFKVQSVSGLKLAHFLG